MPTVVFIYRIGQSTNYIGKYVTDNIENDTMDDMTVHEELLKSLNTYRRNRGYRLLRRHELRVGVLSVSTEMNCSRYEVPTFDFYHYADKSYLNGRVVKPYNTTTDIEQSSVPSE